MSIIASTGCTPRSRATSDMRCGSFDIVSIRYTQSQSGGRASAPTMRGPLYGAFATSTSARLIDGSRNFAFCCASGRVADVLPYVPLVERRIAFERQQHVQGARMRLDRHAAARRNRLVGEVVVRTPQFRCNAHREHAERDRHARLDGEILQPVEVLAHALRIASHRFAGDLEDAGVQFAHRVDDGAHFAPVGDAARHGALVGR